MRNGARYSEGQNHIFGTRKNHRANNVSPATTLEWECSKLWCVEAWFYRSCRTIAKSNFFSSLWVVLVVRQCRISSFSCSGFSFAEECVSLCVVHADSFSIQLHISCKCEYVSLFSVYPNSDKHVTDHGQFQQLQLVLFFAFLWIKNIIIIIDQLRQIFFFNFFKSFSVSYCLPEPKHFQWLK